MTRAVAAGLLLLLAVACTTPEPPRAEAGAPENAACAPPQGPPGERLPTTIDVVEQAYFCILGGYYRAPAMDHRDLLVAGFAALTRAMPEAPLSLPALTGDRRADWAAFEAAYRKTTDREDLAVVTLEAMVAALDDNHARWAHGPDRPPGYYDGDGYGLGLQVSGDDPVFVSVVEGGAAREAGLRPGDVVENADDPELLRPRYPDARPVELRLRRGDRRWSVTLTPGLYPRDWATLRTVQARLVDDAVYVRVRGFSPDAANRVFRSIDRLRAGRSVSGIVLDLRGNGGGSPLEATRLVSAFVHGKVTSYLCRADDRCEPGQTDDTVPLVGLPVVVLVDRGCASACEHFSSAVKDHRAGTLVGTRTAGLISGPAQPFLLRDNTVLSFPTRRHLGPDREIVDRIGVAPDHFVPPTPEDAAAGHDAALAKALTLLDG
ncbi:peptidase [Herbidospora sp. NEAU-GS84]|uniref:Peptidase n=1 Tax=Herbidospora solisilvae TaxID=2696284 RepID=A0A7C9NLI8_9ACTN|nr:S41 family peptidase [Herbidospora solisilvae]NAS21436.1 peptidase [Herbidospora solisilvae]